jgi:hypothetical protein
VSFTFATKRKLSSAAYSTLQGLHSAQTFNQQVSKNKMYLLFNEIMTGTKQRNFAGKDFANISGADEPHQQTHRNYLCGAGSA